MSLSGLGTPAANADVSWTTDAKKEEPISVDCSPVEDATEPTTMAGQADDDPTIRAEPPDAETSPITPAEIKDETGESEPKVGASLKAQPAAKRMPAERGSVGW